MDQPIWADRQGYRWPIVRIILVVFLGLGAMYKFVPEAKPYFHALFDHTLTLLAGCGATVVLGLFQKYVFKKPLSLKWEITILLAFVFFAGFQAWRDEHQKSTQAEAKLEDLTKPQLICKIDSVTFGKGNTKDDNVIAIISGMISNRAHDGGICRGELLSLKRDCVQLKDSADERGFWGTIAIRRGLKRAARRRDIPITEDMADVLNTLLSESKCEYVFTGLHNHFEPLSANTLADQHRAIMETCSFHPDAGLHALRHTFLTEAGRHTQNVRALQKLAGHSRIETTMRYVHPDQEDVLEIVASVQEARTGRIQASPATISATVSQQQAGESRKI